MFSSRFPATLTLNALSRARIALEQQGVPIDDLTETNPTRAGLTIAREVLALLADSRGVHYEPDPMGLSEARKAIAKTIEQSSNRVIDQSQIILTASTSEAYSWLFKLLCDPGASVLVPQPSYPLFDLLSAFEGVRARPYLFEYHGRWSIDRASVENAIDPTTRALLVVSPNNPTGAMLRRDDRDWLVDVCASRNLALIADEVFGDYPLSPPRDGCSLAGENRALTFTLGGLSKSAGLPQMKLAWIVVSGPNQLLGPALERLVLLADTYLSVSTAVQHAAPSLIAAGDDIRKTICERIRGNLAALRTTLRSYPSVTLLEPDAGWSAVMQVPSAQSEETIVLDLLNRGKVLVHPGYFFDFPREAFIIVSLLVEPRTFSRAIDRMLPIVALEPA